MKSNVKFFPFSPGIPWKIKSGKYVIPEMSSPLWQSVTKDKDITVVCNGGLLESFFSCTILETLNYVSPKSTLYWAGDSKFLSIIEVNGLAKKHNSSELLTQNVVSGFPVPLFLDKQNNVYFNCLNNYIKVFTYYNKLGYLDKRPSFLQIFQNSLMPWNMQFIPKLRNIPSVEFDNWMKLSRLQNKSFVLLVPEITGCSQHSEICLDLEPVKIKALAAMLFQKNIATIVMTNSYSKYLDPQLQVAPFNLKLFLYLAQKAKAVLSGEADFLLISNAISRAKIISFPLKDHLSLDKNNRMLERDNTIYSSKELSPLIIFNKVME